MLWQDFPGQVRDAAFIGKGKLARQLLDGHPRHVNGLLVRIVFDGELPAGGAQEVVVHSLVDAVPADREPVVDTAQRSQDAAIYAGFLGDLADGSLFVVFVAFRVPLRQAPLQPSAPVKAGNYRDPEFGVGCVHHNAAGGDFLDRRERGRSRMLGRRDVGTDCRRQRWVCPPAGSARYGMGHEVHSNDSCPSVMTGT